MRYWAALQRINTLTFFPWRWRKHIRCVIGAWAASLRQFSRPTLQGDINNYIAEAVELFAAAPPAHAATAAACQAIPSRHK